MKRFKNVNSLPVAPATWRDPINGHKIEFRSAHRPFSAFLSEVWAYCEANNREKPSQEAIETELCGQWPSWACVNGNFHTAIPQKVGPQRATGCSACAKKRMGQV